MRVNWLLRAGSGWHPRAKTNNAATVNTEAVSRVSTERLTGIVLAANLAPAQSMWTAVPDKNKTNMNEQNKPVLGVKSSDTRLSGGEAHLRVKKMSAAGDSTRAVIEAATKTLTGMISTLTPALTMWTAVPDKNKTNMNEQSTPILVVKSSDTSLCGGKAHLRVKKMSAASDSTKVVIGAATEALTISN